MNKKVLSAILFSALFAGTGTFTSCIDNDEPAGIEELRGAKAELIRAKVAVEQAEAAFKLAQAEVQKAEAARLESLAKINEASARLEEARAEAQEIQNEEDRAVLEKTIAEYEMYLEEQAVKHELTMVQNQQNLAVAKRQYELALKSIEIAEALMSEKAQVWVSDLKKDVNRLLWAVERKEAQIKNQQDALYDAAKYIGAETEFQIAQAEYNLNAAKATLEANALEIAKYESYMAIDTAATESDWRAEIAEIEAEIAEVDKKMADYQLELVKNKESEETKALAAAVAAAEKAKGDIKVPMVAEELKYAYKYFEGSKEVVTTIGKDKTQAEAIDLIAAENAVIDALKGEIATYTTEKQYWLDSIADMDETAKENFDKQAATALKNWKEAKTAYASALTAADIEAKVATIWKADGTGAYPTFKKAKEEAAKLTDPNEKTKAILKAEQTFADALVAFYNSLPAAQVTLSNVSLPVTVGTGANATTVLQTKTVKAWLSDATNKDVYLNQIYSYFGSWEKLWKFTTGDKNEVLNEGGKTIKTKSNSAFTAWVKKDALVLAKKTALETASDAAFGDAAQYSDIYPTLATGTVDNFYLHNEPSDADFLYVFNKGGNVGAYGLNKLGKDATFSFVANNYKDIIADLNAAIDFWTAAVEEWTATVEAYKAELDEADKAIAAAQKAFDDHKKVFVDAFNNAVVGLQEKIASLKNVKFALINAVDAYLANEFENYEGEVKFMEFLAEELEAAQEMTAVLKYNVAVAEADLKAAKDGKFYDAELVKAEEEELAKLEEDLAELLEKLEAKLAELATAEEIWAGK